LIEYSYHLGISSVVGWGVTKTLQEWSMMMHRQRGGQRRPMENSRRAVETMEVGTLIHPWEGDEGVLSVVGDGGGERIVDLWF
jgi:hypothetical protein